MHTNEKNWGYSSYLYPLINWVMSNTRYLLNRKDRQLEINYHRVENGNRMNWIGNRMNRMGVKQ